MLTIADENMPFAREAFGSLGEVRSLPGRSIGPGDVRGADILAVRSVTRVDERLLSGSRVRFVGTATIGTDHVDTAYLERAGIGFASAPGCNAVSVAEYVVAALLVLARRHRFSLGEKCLGIIGVGNVGSRVLERSRVLGMKVIANDPPLAEKTGDPLYRPLEEVIEGADIITLHVPLTREGAYPTYHMANQRFLDRVKPGAMLFNTSRGAVAGSAALKQALEDGRLAATVLDVWENEPGIDMELMRRTDIATPHIAGYSYDGKIRGTTMIYQAACRHFSLEPAWDAAGLAPASENSIIHPAGGEHDRGEELEQAVAAAYDILADDSRLRQMAGLPPIERGARFDSLRREYPVRREFEAFSIKTTEGVRPEILRILAGLGFRTG